MDLKSVLTEVQSWPREDRLRLIEEVWDGLDEEEPETELSEDVRSLLDRRLEALETHPENVVAWEVVEARARERFQK